MAAKNKTVIMTKRLEVKIPSIPNYIQVGENYALISKFTEEELRKIGETWTEELVVKAKNLRKK